MVFSKSIMKTCQLKKKSSTRQLLATLKSRWVYARLYHHVPFKVQNGVHKKYYDNMPVEKEIINLPTFGYTEVKVTQCMIVICTFMSPASPW